MWQWRNDNPYGNNLAQGTIEFNLRFAGQYYDSESGLHYNIHRTYNPEIGRYMQSDPLGLVAGSNTYNYVGRNPFDSVDPLGLSERDVLKIKQIFSISIFFFFTIMTTYIHIELLHAYRVDQIPLIEDIEDLNSIYYIPRSSNKFYHNILIAREHKIFWI